MITIGIDVETTGFSRQDEIVQIGAVALDKAETELASMSVLIHTLAPIPTKATEVHGITDGMVENAIARQQAISSLLAFVGLFPQPVLVSHHAAFESRFLAPEFVQPIGCTLALAREMLGTVLPNHDLVTVAEALGLNTDIKRHNALDDARLAAAIWIRLSK